MLYIYIYIYTYIIKYLYVIMYIYIYVYVYDFHFYDTVMVVFRTLEFRNFPGPLQQLTVSGHQFLSWQLPEDSEARSEGFSLQISYDRMIHCLSSFNGIGYGMM